MTTQHTTQEPTSTNSLKTLTLTTLQKEIKKLRLARTKLSQSIKMLEKLMETLEGGLTPEAPAPKLSELTPKPKLSDHPAIQTYRDVFHTYPQRGVYQLVIESVGDKPEDLEIWRECCTWWMGNGYNPKNINGQLENYNDQWTKASVPELAGSVRFKTVDGLRYTIHDDGSRELAANTD